MTNEPKDDKILVEVKLMFNDGTSKTVKPKETDTEARDRLLNPYKGELDDVYEWIIPKLNKLGGQLDIAFTALIQKYGFDGEEAEDEINKLIETEML